jgi:UDP-N-acetylglucosamine 2-epimerase (non-hydrolysing)
MLSCVSDLHFAPTAYAAENLLREGVPREEVVVAGNTVVDALLLALSKRPETPVVAPREGADGRMVLITIHRREGWEPVVGEAPLEAILREIRAAAEEHAAVDFVFPVHPNPRVREPAQRILAGRDNVRLIEPQPYIPFVDLMARATVILTDSGGIQEEAPSLGVPVLVLRRTTERPEGLPSSKRLLGDSPAQVRAQLARYLAHKSPRPVELPATNPFGDGLASARIRDAILHFMGRGERPDEFGEPRPLQSRRGPGPR